MLQSFSGFSRQNTISIAIIRKKKKCCLLMLGGAKFWSHRSQCQNIYWTKEMCNCHSGRKNWKYYLNYGRERKTLGYNTKPSSKRYWKPFKINCHLAEKTPNPLDTSHLGSAIFRNYLLNLCSYKAYLPLPPYRQLHYLLLIYCLRDSSTSESRIDALLIAL